MSRKPDVKHSEDSFSFVLPDIQTFSLLVDIWDLSGTESSEWHWGGQGELVRNIPDKTVMRSEFWLESQHKTNNETD